ncbi:phosphatase PAP2 family protein [Leuconostoc falkenbergense]|jgi:membrane-associated phospholipid phosphatase|uniref:Phosphatase PAP2 family protein n=1 Tax=Leuconostoc falkenbergense TaxID=2766470 RepID=A0A9X3EAY5_9LACO|nr:MULTISPECIES: phosphatase PAP2 family protein [Leuconostoc]RDG18668.1 PAP2 family protein [Leuconostoc pseudomesenteroides]MCT4410023.1 phosphatase PAP2 family protein [Leuconostoc falkenbergense]MCX7579747.1 phosphatase PAP2 family protein [Leuconostoc falkenbergense]MDM7647372.1 phosphatase PAP2 family protein [Leuconostoc falkenbergense]MDV3546491.1 phosphatase PAP2 family protein [Leuconostoc falkenbergense]
MQLTGNDANIKAFDTTDTDFQTTSSEKKVVTVLLGLGVVSLLVATFFDKNVTNLVMNQNSIFGNIFQNYADQGANIVLFAAFEIIAWTIWRRIQDDVLRYVMTIGALAFAFNQMLAILQDMLSYTYSMLNNLSKGIPMGVANNTAAVKNYPEVLRWGLAVILTAVLSVLFYNWLQSKSDADIRYLITAALVGIAVVFIAQTTIGEMKSLWGRFRPYEMTTVAGNTMSEFTPWYHLNGINGHNSFPSGHTMSGWLFLYLVFFVPRGNISAQKKMTIFGIAMGILTAMSRVRIGAHWLSDVTVSSIIVGLIIFMASRLLAAHFVEPTK